MQRRNKSTCRNIKGKRGGNTNDAWRHVMNRLGGRSKARRSTCRNIKGKRGGNTNDAWRHVMNRLGGRSKARRSTCRRGGGVGKST
jgi:ribosomal protein L20A (L18A)